MPGPLKDYWTEFDWEAELKKDDARISTYSSPAILTCLRKTR